MLSYDRCRASRLCAGRVVRLAAGLLGRIFSNHYRASERRWLHQSHHRPIDWDNRRCGRGRAVAYLLPHTSVLSLGIALVIALVPLTLVAALWPNYRIAPLTAVIVLLTPGAQQLGPLDPAFHRIVEITLGSFVGLGVSLVLLPARAHGLVIGAAARMLGHLADLLGDWLAVLGGSGDRTRIGQ